MFASKCGARLDASAVPVFDFARALAREGVVPGGTKRNLAYVAEHVRFDDTVEPPDRLILADAQTSGGLLTAVSAEAEAGLLADLEKRGTLAAVTIGEVVAGEPGSVEVVAG